MLRRARRLAVALATVTALAACDAGSGTYPTCRDCNVVVISVDTLRADHVGALGYAKPTTPEFDVLAQRGALFENAISQSSWTRPAHMSIFTGLHPREHGFIALADTRRLEDSIPTLASVLRDNGYRTAAFVGGVNMSAAYGFDRGFDVYRSSGKYFRDNLKDTREWLDHRGTGKFFLFLHGYDAHTPYLNDPVDREALGLSVAPPTGTLAATCRSDGPLSRIDPYVDEYDAAVHRADRFVGTIVRELETRGLLARTILVVLSDHGEEFLEHDRCFHIATLHREVLHVPLLVVAPGLPPRRIAEAVSASVTIAPTVMEMLGISGHPFPGPSLLGAASGGRVPADPIVSETERNTAKKGQGHVRALTTDRDKLIHWITRGRFALFDTEVDTAERRELDDPARRRSGIATLDAWTAAHPARTATRRRQPDDAERKPADPKAEAERRQRQKELRALGYAH